jgi:hypothetical protein
MNKIMLLFAWVVFALSVCSCGKKAPSPWKEMGFPLSSRYASLEIAQPDQLTIKYSAGFTNTWVTEYTQALENDGWQDATQDPEYPRFAKDGNVIEIWTIESPGAQGATIVLKMKNAGEGKGKKK